MTGIEGCQDICFGIKMAIEESCIFFFRATGVKERIECHRHFSEFKING